MDKELAQIYLKLVKNPNHIYITADGTALYVLGWHGNLLKMTGENLHLLNAEQANQYFQDHINELG